MRIYGGKEGQLCLTVSPDAQEAFIRPIKEIARSDQQLTVKIHAGSGTKRGGQQSICNISITDLNTGGPQTCFKNGKLMGNYKDLCPSRLWILLQVLRAVKSGLTGPFTPGVSIPDKYFVSGYCISMSVIARRTHL